MKLFYDKKLDIFSKEVYDKGYYDNVYLSFNKKYYKIVIYDKIRFIQDFEDELTYEGAFTPISNLVIVDNISYDSILKTLIKIKKEGVIDYFMPCDLLNEKIIYIKSNQQINRFKQLNLPYYVIKDDLVEFLNID